jgi:hypothetical protein
MTILVQTRSVFQLTIVGIGTLKRKNGKRRKKKKRDIGRKEDMQKNIKRSKEKK